MSVIHDDAAHFTRWLLRQAPGGSEEEVAESYVPRVTYGDYVHDTLKQAVAAVAGRVQVDIVESTATELVERDGVYTARRSMFSTL
jgi:uncharacterized NAD(P)/FAD-binding protein YdhS